MSLLKTKEISFYKMHGNGNDFIIIDQRDNDFNIASYGIKLLCNRKYGIGCDQLIIIKKSQKYDCELKIYNSDGSIATACGNGTRCVAQFLQKNDSKILINNRIIVAKLLKANKVKLVISKPIFENELIPLAKTVNDPLNIAFDIKGFELGAAVNVGNPHLVFFSNDIDSADIANIAQQVLDTNYFPEGVNINFAQVVDDTKLKLRVWERGVKETNSCGTGACATYIIAKKLGVVKNNNIEIQLKGGSLSFSTNKNQNIEMYGDAQHVYKGQIKL